MVRDSGFDNIYKSIVEKEFALSKYMRAQSRKLIAVSNTEQKLLFEPSEIKNMPLYQDINRIIEFLIKNISLSLKQVDLITNFVENLNFKNSALTFILLTIKWPNQRNIKIGG